MNIVPGSADGAPSANGGEAGTAAGRSADRAAQPAVGRDRLVWVATPRQPIPRRHRVRALLGGLDLDAVPASVTPPRTWRRAAAFAVAASCAVLLALSAMALLTARPEQLARQRAAPADEPAGTRLIVEPGTAPAGPGPPGQPMGAARQDGPPVTARSQLATGAGHRNAGVGLVTGIHRTVVPVATGLAAPVADTPATVVADNPRTERLENTASFAPQQVEAPTDPDRHDDEAEKAGLSVIAVLSAGHRMLTGLPSLPRTGTPPAAADRPAPEHRVAAGPGWRPAGTPPVPPERPDSDPSRSGGL